jgi:uncharacterized protein (DUF736 family)
MGEDPRTTGGKPQDIKYVPIGGAWKNQTKEGKEFISITLGSTPIGGEFTGRLTLWPRDNSDTNVPF